MLFNQRSAMMFSMVMETISREDLKRLLADPCPFQRADIAGKIALLFKERQLGEQEQQQVSTILNLIAQDTEHLVRLTLSRVLHDCPDIPHGIALRLLEDTDSIALPLLKACLVLNDEDLIPYAIGRNTLRQRALAGRPLVSDYLSHALIHHSDTDVHHILASNHGAALSEKNLSHLLNLHVEDERFKEKLVTRPSLPPAFAEQLLNVVADNLKEYLVTHTAIRPEVVRKIVTDAQERVTIQSTQKPGRTEIEIEQLVQQLHQQERLSDRMIVRALCSGEVRFFEKSLSCRSGLTTLQVHKLLQAGSEETFRALCQKSAIQPSLIKLLRISYAQAMMVAGEGVGSDFYHPPALQQRQIELLLTTEQSLPEDISEFLWQKLSA
jgi:uncharacterized protein (DUF2336 family)